MLPKKWGKEEGFKSLNRLFSYRASQGKRPFDMKGENIYAISRCLGNVSVAFREQLNLGNPPPNIKFKSSDLHFCCQTAVCAGNPEFAATFQPKGHLSRLLSHVSHSTRLPWDPQTNRPRRPEPWDFSLECGGGGRKEVSAFF